MRTFKVYKGLQKPLVFKGFKGKYIYYGAACLGLSLILGVLVIVIINLYVGATVLLGGFIGGLLWISFKQKQGLYSKKRDRNIFVLPPRFKILNYGK